EAVGMPRVLRRFFAPEEAADEVVNHQHLRQPEDQSTDRHELIEVQEFGIDVVLRVIVYATGHTVHADHVHGEEDQVHEREGEDEVNLPQRIVHHSAEHFRIPEIDRHEHAHDRSAE